MLTIEPYKGIRLMPVTSERVEQLQDARIALETRAATQASRKRFRAVLLTSLTTIVGLTPLLAERSLQAQVLIPLAVSVVFGLLATTFLVLLVVPVLYCILGDLGVVRHPDSATAVQASSATIDAETDPA